MTSQLLAPWSFVAFLALSANACGGGHSRPVAPSDGARAPALTPITASDSGPPGVVEAGITLTTSDGVEIAATYLAGPPDNFRCVVLVHQLSSTRAEWAPVVAALAGRYHVLALDLRGHGESVHGKASKTLSWRDFGEDDWRDTMLDLEAARDFLAALQVRTDSCVYVGSSIGATTVLRMAGKYFDMAGVALLSPGISYRGINVMSAAKQFHNPTLLISSGEPGPAEAADLLATMWAKEDAAHRVQRYVAKGHAHGMKMAADDPAMVPALVAFIDASLAALN